MYEAKARGRDRYVVYTDVTTGAGRAQMPWEQRIRRALDNDGFVLHCQPILTLGSRDVEHYEVLLRLREADGTLTSRARSSMSPSALASSTRSTSGSSARRSGSSATTAT